MARGAGEPSAKRAKVDEAKEEEDPLVRRKEEVVRLLGRARKGKDNARAKKELVTLCDDFEAKNEKLLGRLLPELWEKITGHFESPDLLAFAMTCRFFREKQKDLKKKMETIVGGEDLVFYAHYWKVTSHTLGWFRWVCDTFKILPGYEKVHMNAVGFRYTGRLMEPFCGDVYEGVLLNYAAFQGSIEILWWLMEEKGCKLNKNTGWYAGVSGSVEVLEYLKFRGYEFNEMACNGAAREGHLEVLKFARDQDPPCPWDQWTCTYAAGGGRLEVLKWLRSQDPPCPWSRSDCRAEASMHGHQHVVDWIDQQEDESDTEYTVEYSDSD